MEKVTHFLGQTEQGVFAQALFGSAGAFEKVAGAEPFADWETGDEIRRYIAGITKADRERYCYVLVNALGAGEFFGSNINADYFPWESLKHRGMDYGYQTFLNAHAFQHHKNKDPERAFGVPVLSALNERMKRVELIVRLDREKARLEGAEGIIDRIDQGQFPDVSMGCKVPYDVCSICGNKAKGQDDYCVHIKPPPELVGIYGKNKILADGRRIYMLNLWPRFFDISFVFIGADKTAKVMAKLASAGSRVCMGPVCTVPSAQADEQPLLVDHLGQPLTGRSKTASSCEEGMRGPCGRLCSSCPEVATCHTTKLASAFGVKKTAAGEKLAELIKQIPPLGLKTLRSEPDLPTPALDDLAGERTPAALGALSSLGIVLVRMGHGHAADEFDRRGVVFRESSDFENVRIDFDEETNRIITRIGEALRDLIKHRSAYGHHLPHRMTHEGRHNFVLPTPHPVKHSVLDKVSAAYNGYRREVLMKLSQAREAVESDPKLRELILGENLVNMFSKHASHTKVADLNSVAYMMGAHLSNPGLLSTTAVADAVVANNPWLLDEEHPA